MCVVLFSNVFLSFFRSLSTNQLCLSLNATVEENQSEEETQPNPSTAMETTETMTTKKKKKTSNQEHVETLTETTMAATTAYEQEYVETSRADRLIWLLKCPRMASRLLQTLSHHDCSSSSSSSSSPSRPVVGKVAISVDPCHPGADASSTQFTMELATSETDNIPRRYRMDMSDAQVPMSVFSVSSQGKVSVEGKIPNKMDMKPHEDSLDSYRKLCRERTRSYKAKTRQIRVIDDDNGARMRPMPGTFLGKKEPTNKGCFSRRARRDRREVEEMLFKLFERHPNWNFKQLTQETDQPELYLKEILKDVCDYNCRGDNQGTYTLKPEYRLANNETDAANIESHEDKEKEAKATSQLPAQ